MAIGLDLDAIPLWRKIVILSGFCGTLALGGVLAHREFDFYVSGARSPHAVTGEIYPVSVNHGYVRYLTAKDYESYEAWKRRFSLPMLPAILVLVTCSEFWKAIREAGS